MRIVLVEPEIPQNTGNIARTCAVTGTELHLIEPMGFSVDEKHVRRAGLDYWPLVKLRVHKSFEDYAAEFSLENTYFLSTKAKKKYCDARFRGDYALVFGKETKGLSQALLERHWDMCLRIPMIDEARSLNLSNSVAVVLYEALRQNGFAGIE
ncbi:MAG: tRNA (cytidine(34)-2'-O)-methyltransferase [Christensenellales bacterium]|jgi:tRNA (cytidine/uridine-2'-O-)-methyltransferase